MEFSERGALSSTCEANMGRGAGEKKFYLALRDSHRGKGEEMKDKKGQGYWVWKGHTKKRSVSTKEATPELSQNSG